MYSSLLLFHLSSTSFLNASTSIGFASFAFAVCSTSISESFFAAITLKSS